MTDARPVFPFAREEPFGMAPQLRESRDAAGLCPVRSWDGKDAWLVSRYDDVRAVLGDDRFSSNKNHPGYPGPNPFFSIPQPEEELMFLNLDNPAHDFFKRIFAPEFTLKAVERVRPAADRLVERLVEEMVEAGSPADLVDALALPVPVNVICGILGVPVEDFDFFEEHTRAIMSFLSTPEEASRASSELDAYFLGLIEQKKTRPGDDLLTRVLTEHISTGALTAQQLASTCQLLISAGHETTATMIATGTLALLAHPGQRDVFIAGDDAARAAAVEELLRYLSIPNAGRRRVALADVEVAGQLVHAGEGVIVATDSANHDERVFEDPAQLDLARRPKHVAFGWGIHQCIGQNLARMELLAAYTGLFRRLPQLRLAVPIEQLEFNQNAIAYGVRSLPVEW